MNGELQELIDRYLSGSASADEVGQLDALVREDPSARHALLMASALEAQLRKLLVSAAPHAPAAPASRDPVRWRLGVQTAAVLLVAVGGWATAFYFANQYRAKCDQYATALRTLAELGAAPLEDPLPQDPTQPGATGRVVETRGLVGILPEGQNDFVHVRAGAPIPIGRSLWTCPWGAAGMRFADGVSLQLDRSTVVVFSEIDGIRHAAVKSGIFYITKPEASQAGPFVVTTIHASTTIINAQVAVAADGDRTIVEVAVGEVRVTGRANGRAISVPAAHYAIVTDTAEPQVIKGRFDWRLEPAKPDQ